MIRQIAAAFALALQVFATAAMAADNTVVLTPGTGVTMRTKDVGGGVQSAIQILGDTSGNPLATAPGTPNSVFALPIQGVTGGTAIPVSAASLPLPTGAATSALQTTGNTALTTINTTLGSPMQTSGGSVTANAGTNLNTSALATQTTLASILANQGTNGATNAHTCSIGGFSELSCLGQIDDDVKGAIPSGSNTIGAVTQASGPWTVTSTGAISNASSAVTTSSTNMGTVAYNYGFNGTTWDQLQVDASKFLKVNATNFPTTVDTNAGNAGASTIRAVIASNQVNLPTINGASLYQAEPASTSITALTGGGGGAAGDYLSHCTVIPTTVSPGVFTITDNSTAIYSFPGGASSLSNLVPWTVPVGAKSSSGAWKVTTGAGLSIVCVGKFT